MYIRRKLSYLPSPFLPSLPIIDSLVPPTEPPHLSTRREIQRQLVELFLPECHLLAVALRINGLETRTSEGGMMMSEDLGRVARVRFLKGLRWMSEILEEVRPSLPCSLARSLAR
jgi:hypothetical protein